VIRTVIVDDEELGRRGVRARLAGEADIDIVAECSSGPAAVETVTTLSPDLLFLDVEMPEFDGFDVIDALESCRLPHLVFVTAHDRFAVRAFDVNALDYVLKPIDDVRFARTLNRVRKAMARELPEGDGSIEARVRAVVEAVRRNGQPSSFHRERIAVRNGGKVVLVPVEDIDWVEAAGDYVTLHAGKREHLLRETMGSIERRLDPDRFVRIHRSTIVRIDRVAELLTTDNGDFVVALRNGRELKLSRGYRNALDRFADGLT